MRIKMPPTTHGHSKVYDCFIFFNELDLLEIRLNILNAVVDRFVIVEADKTHSNKAKPFYFEQNKERYAPFLEKIIYIKIDSYPALESTWEFENYQRNMITEGIKNCDPDDIIIISDLDEIPNPKIIKDYKGGGLYKAEQFLFYYFLNYKAIINRWYGSKILTYKDILNNCTENYTYEYNETLIESLNRGCTPTKIRMVENVPMIKNGGWHFSYLGGLDAIRYKIASFSHQEYNSDEYTNDNILNYCVKKGYALFSQGTRFIPIKIDSRFPEYIIQNQDTYRHLIYKEIPLLHNFFIITKTYLHHFIWRLPFEALKKFLKKTFWYKKAKILLQKYFPKHTA
jgi:beta-1,4-mannosyl-glycoprotein beta-1,4-N-acetylglucosaminyltransferase